jgi:predicted transcriptional regulator
MASVTERKFWIEWVKKQHNQQFQKALEAFTADEQKEIRAKAKARWARENGVTVELKRLEEIHEDQRNLNDQLSELSKIEDKLLDRVADTRDCVRYQAGNFMREHVQAADNAMRDAALKRAGIDSLDPFGIEAVIMAATTSQQLMDVVSKLAAALGATLPSV